VDKLVRGGGELPQTPPHFKVFRVGGTRTDEYIEPSRGWLDNETTRKEKKWTEGRVQGRLREK